VLLAAFPDARQGRPAERSALERVHARAYLDILAALDRPTWFDYPNTIASETSWEAALLAAGCAIDAAETGSFALVRPPGHHAPPQGAMGFCLINNIAVATRHMQEEHGLGRVAIVDFDVHHGNGSEDAFWNDDSVLYVSLHQIGIYPGTGTGGNETTINIPLAPGGGDDEYVDAFERIVEPAVRAFEPDLLLVSAGFDAHDEEDIYLVDMHLSEDGFRELSRRCAALAPRVAAVLEGGYNLATLPRLIAASLEGFGESTTAG
jgi:acetoin utilization deacetylase AcuC-like enzyme